MNCVRHEENYNQEVLATWPRGSSARFCSEGCAAFYGLEAATQTTPSVPVAKDVAPGQPHAKGASTSIQPGDPTQAVQRTAQTVERVTTPVTPVAPVTPDGVNQGDALDAMSHEQLRAECASRGVSSRGATDDLLARIRAHDEAEAAS
jgi:hypothetical protein